ncbi:MAG: hypothetical protein ACE5JI_21305 [Acidobacteriota bacterium]
MTKPLKITRIEDQGTIVRVFAQNADGFEIINFDHRPFSWLWEAEGGNVIGREIEYDGERVRFVDGDPE